ncbi:MAG TPA: MlaE family lipid ABC transporter permease subunit [Candidatus Polarisedimenticolaceae bacterium]|nr:MlaE family lipid ABC transporter permease subunit [Candidatus Polarisedimenticolaceae bacterium]
MDSSGHLEFRTRKPEDSVLEIIIKGRLDSFTTSTIWRKAKDTVAAAKIPTVLLDASGINYCDGSGVALLVQMRDQQLRSGGYFEIRGLQPELQALVEGWQPGDFAGADDQREDTASLVEEIGRSIVEICYDIYSLIIFIGELATALARAAFKPRAARWRDTLRIAESVGVNAVPIVALIGFLMGLIMAFQAAIPLGQFGAQIFVANLIGLAILRELGPLMTAIVLAGRSGSAFAAELGTMKVREELDALKTMGLEPVPFLVVPRVIAAVLMTPLLTIFADLVGLIGGAVVLLSLGFPLITFWNQVQLAVGYGDLLGGLAKSFVFGVLVAAIGCLRGLQTQTGASAVGESTTRAVVSGIILIVIADGVFSVIYYYLGI